MLEDRNLKATLAAELSVGPYQISRWLTGQDRPRAAERGKVEDLLGLSWRLWEDEPPTEEKVKSAIGDALAASPGGLAGLRARAAGVGTKDVA